MLLFACAFAANAESLRIAVARGTVSLPIYVAQANGYFAEEGIDVELSECASGRECLEQLARGEAQIGSAAELPVVLANRAGEQFTIIATISSTSHQIKLIARRSAGVQRAEDLKRKRVASVPGTSAQYFLASWLLYHGMPMKDVSFVPISPDRSVDALRSGVVDALSIWEPHATNAMKAVGNDAFELPNPRVYTQHFVLTLRRAEIERHADALPRILRALAKAKLAIKERPALAHQTLAARLSISPEEASAALQGHDFRLRLDQALVNTMSQQLRWAQQEGIGKKTNAELNPVSWIDESWLKRTVPNSTSLPSN